MWLLELITTDQYRAKELIRSGVLLKDPFLELTISPDMEVSIIDKSSDSKEIFLYREFKMKDWIMTLAKDNLNPKQSEILLIIYLEKFALRTLGYYLYCKLLETDCLL